MTLDTWTLRAALDVGLTPVRDVIKRLMLEKLVVTYPRRGTFAAEIKISDERWLAEARTGMEGLAALFAAQLAADAEREHITRTLRQPLTSTPTLLYLRGGPAPAPA